MKKNVSGQKKKNGFVMGLLLYVMIMLVVGYSLLLVLWKYAEQYERTLPTDFMESYVETLDISQVRTRACEALSSVPHEFQTDDECAEHVLAAAENTVSYSRTTSQGNDDSVSYNIYCGSMQVGTVTLAPDYSGNIRFSMVPWKLVAENYCFQVEYSPLQVLVPAGGRLEINGQTVDESYVTAADVRNPLFENYYDVYADFPYWTEYTVEHLVGEVPFCIYDASGAVCTKGDSTDYAALLEPGVGRYDRVAEFIDNFLYRYIYFTSALYQDYWGGYNSLSGYLLPGSDLQIRMRNAIDGLTWANSSGFSIDSLELHSIYSLGNGWYLCDFTSTFTIIEKGTTTNNYRLLVLDNNDDLRAADLNLY